MMSSISPDVPRAGQLSAEAFRPRRREPVAAAVAFAALTALSSAFSVPAHAQVVVPSPPPWNWLWTGAPGGTWGGGGDPFGNWTLFEGTTPLEFRPNSPNDDVYINPQLAAHDVQGTSAATIESGGHYTVGRLNLAVNTSLTMQGNTALTIAPPFGQGGTWGESGAIRNFGDILLNSAAGDAGLNATLLFSNNTTLTGTGTVTLGNSLNDGIAAVSPGATMTIDAGATVRGGGRINNVFNQSFLNVVNNGTINASNSAGLIVTLFADGGGTLTNNGTLRASSGSTLTLLGVNPNNVLANAGTIEALNGSFVRIGEGVTVSGGTIATTGTGSVRGGAPGSGGGTLKNVINTGSVISAPGEVIRIAGTFTNNGTVSLNGSDSETAASVELGEDATLAGTGKVVLNGSHNSQLGGRSAGRTLTVAPSATIEGGGSIGGLGFQVGPQAMNLINNGLIQANSPAGPLSILLPNDTGTLTNSGGTLRARDGGTLRLTSGAFNNVGGTIEALDGSTVRVLANATVTGGTLNTAGTGAIRGGTPGSAGGVLNNVTSKGRVVVSTDESLRLQGTFTNNGTLSLDAAPGGGGASVYLNGPVTIAGSGTIALTDYFGNSIGGAGPNTPLTIANGVTIQGSGNLGGNGSAFGPQSVNLVNHGTIVDTGTGNGLTVRAQSNLSNAGGTLRAAGATGLSVASNEGGSLDNTGGTIEALDTGAFSMSPNLALSNLTGGTLSGGTYRAIGATATLDVTGGAVTSIASGTIVVVGGSGGAVRFGNTPVQNSLTSNAGTFQVEGARTVNISNPLMNSGSLVAKDAGSAIAVNGTLTSTGTLSGRGTVSAAAVSNGGTVAPGNSPGVLTLAGDYVQTGGGKLQIELGGTAAGTGYDRLAVTGSAALGGTLDLSPINGFIPSAGDVFRILTAASRTGTFSAVNGVNVQAGQGGGLALAVTYQPTGVTVTATLPGDINLDRAVGAGDFNLLASNFGKGGQTWSTGDLDGDGVVGPGDFNLLASNFGRSAGAGSAAGVTAADWAVLQSFAATNVPEPTAIATAALMAGLGILRRRRRRFA